MDKDIVPNASTLTAKTFYYLPCVQSVKALLQEHKMTKKILKTFRSLCGSLWARSTRQLGNREFATMAPRDGTRCAGWAAKKMPLSLGKKLVSQGKVLSRIKALYVPLYGQNTFLSLSKHPSLWMLRAQQMFERKQDIQHFSLIRREHNNLTLPLWD